MGYPKPEDLQSQTPCLPSVSSGSISSGKNSTLASLSNSVDSASEEGVTKGCKMGSLGEMEQSRTSV